MSAKILIVEDNPDSCAFLSQLLKVRGYSVQTASDGLQALFAVEEFRPDIIVSDIMMPGITGIEMVRVLRQSPQYREIPVLMISAFGSGNLKEALQAGADSALHKPINFDQFFETLAQLLQRRSTTQTAG